MADIALVKTLSESGALVAAVATTPAGDTVPAQVNGKRKLLHFHNTTGGSITVALVSQVAAGTVAQGLGKVSKANASLAIGAGLRGAFLLTDAELGAYLNQSTNKIEITYTSGNAGLLCTALEF